MGDRTPKRPPDLQESQDPDAAETRRDEEQAPGTTPEARTDHEQDDAPEPTSRD
jgi:hypothetical protein